MVGAVGSGGGRGRGKGKCASAHRVGIVIEALAGSMRASLFSAPVSAIALSFLQADLLAWRADLLAWRADPLTRPFGTHGVD